MSRVVDFTTKRIQIELSAWEVARLVLARVDGSAGVATQASSALASIHLLEYPQSWAS